MRSTGGWDVGPGEDGDITIKIRRLGYKAVFAPYAVCHTDAPDTWTRLFKQRRRWNRGLIRYKCRKHADMANPLAAHFRWGNSLLIMNVWLFKIGALLAFWVRQVWLLLTWDQDAGFLLLTTYAIYQFFNLLQVMALMYYSDRALRDLMTCCVVPFTPFYRTWLGITRLVSIAEETLLRRCFKTTTFRRRCARQPFTGSAQSTWSRTCSVAFPVAAGPLGLPAAGSHPSLTIYYPARPE